MTLQELEDKDIRPIPEDFEVEIIRENGLVVGKCGQRELAFVDKFDAGVTERSIKSIRMAIWYDMEAERLRNKCPQ